MTFGEMTLIDQAEGQPSEGGFRMGEPGAIETDVLLAAIERDISARRFNIESLGTYQRLGDIDARAGRTERAEKHLRNVEDTLYRIADIEAELARLCAQYVAQHQPRAAKEDA